MTAPGTALSPEWLSNVLGRSVMSSTSTRIGTDRGFAGIVLRLRVTDHDGVASSLVAKVGPDPSLAAEIDFYRELRRRLDAPAPRCLYAGEGPTGALLVLEDVPVSRAGDALAASAPSDVAAVLHAMRACWRHRAGEPVLRDLRPWGAEPRDRQTRFRQHWAAQRDALSAELPPDIWQLADRLCNSLAPVAAALRAAPGHAVHADLHMDNVLFAGDRPVVLDWGSICTASPAVDVFAFIGSSLSPPDQDRHFADLVSDLDLDGLMLDDGRRRLLCALAGVIGWRNRAATGNRREHALRRAAIVDGRLINALRLWDAGHVL